VVDVGDVFCGGGKGAATGENATIRTGFGPSTIHQSLQGAAHRGAAGLEANLKIPLGGEQTPFTDFPFANFAPEDIGDILVPGSG
jgi:hypothetical protein